MLVTIRDKTAELRGPSSARLFSVAQKLEGRRKWTGQGFFFEPSEHNLDLLRQNFSSLRIERPAAIARPANVDGRTYSQKTVPFQHQETALTKVRQKEAFFLLMEQGTGKTKVAIDRAGELWAEGAISGVLVVSRKGVHRQWIESQLPEHFGGDWSGSFWDGAKMRVVKSGPGLEWYAFNFDAMKAPRGNSTARAFILRHQGSILIVADETQEIKNPNSARHKALEQLKTFAASPYRFALTGTPIAKDLTDEWAQLRWLDERIIGIRYLTSFRNEYCIMGGFEGRETVGHKNVDRFKARVDPYSFRATKAEIGILPKIHRRWAIDLSPAQKKTIESIRQDLLALLESGEKIAVPTIGAALIKIQQVSNGFLSLTEEKEIAEFSPNPRLSALIEILAAYPGKTIVWARFREDMRQIARRLVAEGITFAEYHGGTGDTARAAAVQSFLAPEGVQVFLSNPQAGGTGLNLQGGCNHAIYYSNSFSAIDRWQSEDRIHRIGTKGAVVYTDIVAKGSIDAMILSNLRKKKNISDLALGDLKEALNEAF